MSDKNCTAVLMGPPGSGKTTVARALAEKGQMTVIETGNLLGAEVKRDSPLGREIMPYKAAGDLVPSHLVKRVIFAELERSAGKFVLFDGFPRSLEQGQLLFEILKERQLTLAAVINLNVDFETVMKRLSGRRLCQNCGALYNIYSNPPRQDGHCNKCGGQLTQRPDDNPAVVQRRFENFQRETIPAIEFFRKNHKDLCLEVPAAEDPEVAAQHVRTRLAKVLT